MNVDFTALTRIEQQLAELQASLPRIVEERLQAILEGREADTLGGVAQLATWLGAPSADAARKRVERDPELAALAVRGAAGGHRRWRRSEVHALLTSRRTSPPSAR